MKIAILSFLAGTLGALAVFLVAARLSGAERFSAPFFVLVIGAVCAVLAVLVSPWATVAVLAAYGALSGLEVARDRAAARSRGSPSGQE